MENKKNFDTLDIFVYLWKNRKPIIIITVLGAIASIVISLMLTNYFKATAVLFPTKNMSFSTTLLQNVNQETDPLLIGDEDDLEKMIQMLQSDYVAERIIKKYDLINRYGLSPNDPHLMSKLYEMYQENITFKKTQYQGVVISVIDFDPKVAASIANDITDIFDSLMYDMQKQRAQEAYDFAVRAYEDELAFIKILEDSLDVFRQKGILDYNIEIEQISEAYWKSLGRNTMTSQNKYLFEQKIQLLQKFGKDAQSVSHQIALLRQNLSQLQFYMVRAQQNLDNPITHKYVVNYASTPDKKFSPKRSIIVVFSTIGAFVFAVALLLLLDFYNEFKKRIKIQNQ